MKRMLACTMVRGASPKAVGWASRLFGLVLGFVAASNALAATDIEWWHAMSGSSNAIVEDLAREFNESQSEFAVVPVFKGSYPETLNAGIEAFRAGDPPDILQVFDVGTAVMIAEKYAVEPVGELMKRAGLNFGPADYLPGIAAYYSDSQGNLLSFPFNSSSPVLFYNRAVFEAAGLDPESPPRTWPELWEAAREIARSGAARCGYTSTWMTWIHLENFAAWNGIPYATSNNGMSGRHVELLINAPSFVEHFTELAALAKEGVFRYGGRTAEAKQLFFSGECAMMTESSGGIGDAVRSGLDFGVAELPYVPEANGPLNTIPGGASLWVFAGLSDETYRGIAAFFAFLSKTETQAALHQASGYVPVTRAAYEATAASGFYKEHPEREVPVREIIGKGGKVSPGIRIVDMPALRDIQNEEIEALLAGRKSVKDALDSAVSRGNAAIAGALQP